MKKFDENMVYFGTRFAGPERRLLRLPGAPIYVGMQNYVGMLRNWMVFMQQNNTHLSALHVVEM